MLRTAFFIIWSRVRFVKESTPKSFRFKKVPTFRTIDHRREDRGPLRLPEEVLLDLLVLGQNSMNSLASLLALAREDRANKDVSTKVDGVDPEAPGIGIQVQVKFEYLAT